MPMSGAGLGNHASQAANQGLTHEVRRDNAWLALLWTLVALMTLMLLGVSITAGIFWWSWREEREYANRLRENQIAKAEELSEKTDKLFQETASLKMRLEVVEGDRTQEDLQDCQILFRGLQMHAVKVSMYTQVLDKIEKLNSARGSSDDWAVADRDRYVQYDRLRCEEAQKHNDTLDRYRPLRQKLITLGVPLSKVSPDVEYLSAVPRLAVFFP